MKYEEGMLKKWWGNNFCRNFQSEF